METTRTIILSLVICISMLILSLVICIITVLSVNGMDRKSGEYKQGGGFRKTTDYDFRQNSTTGSENNAINDYASPSLRHNSSFVGFSAWKQADQIYKDGDIIIFDGVNVNEGAHYQPTFNWFVCPQDAVYYVAVTFKGDSTNDTGIAVMKETERILTSYNNVMFNPSNVNSNSGIVRCDLGERIWVEAVWDGSVVGEPGIPHTTFTIFMMYQGEISPVNELHENFIGSSAWKGFIQEYVEGDTIVFDYFLFNEGNYYLPTVNRFQCPVDGIYYVVTHLTQVNTLDLLLGVKKGTSIILHSEECDNFFNVLSNSRLVHCTAGEYISVVGTGDGHVRGFDHPYDNYPDTTFSVMLLHQENQSTGKHSSFVGFSAWKTMDQSYEIGDTIVFDGILINEGSHYQPGPLSRFICPLPGIYYIAVTFKKLDSYRLNLGVHHQDIIVLRSLDTESQNPHNVLSNSCLVRCYPDEIIQVKAMGRGWADGNEIKPYSTFTVMLMHEF